MGSHYFVTPKAGGEVDRRNLTQVGRALSLAQWGLAKAKDLPEDGRASMLGVIPLNYLADWARPNQTAVGGYIDDKREMDAYRGKWQHWADGIATVWRKRAGKDADAGRALSELMHDSHAGADRPEPHRPGGTRQTRLRRAPGPLRRAAGGLSGAVH